MKKTNYQVEISADTKGFRREIRQGIVANEAFNKSIQGLSSGVTVIDGPLGGIASRITAVRGLMSSGAVAVTGFGAALAGLSAVGYSALQTFSQYEKQQARTEAIIKATGNAAGFTAIQLAQQADQLALGTLASVQGVVQAQNVLQTFKNVQGETFTEAIELSQDLAAVFGGEIKDKALQLGKALEDPKTRLGELAEAGVNFTQSEKDLITSLQDTGDIAAAQGIILEKLRGQVGGAGAAEAGGLSGSVDTLGQRWDELLNAFAKSNGTVGPVKSILDGLSSSLNSVREQIDPTVGGLEKRLAQLQDRVNSGGRGRSAITQRNAAVREIEELKQQLVELKASEGDVESINTLLQQTQDNINNLQTSVSSADDSRRIRRSGSQRTQKDILEARLQEQLDIQKQYQLQLQQIQEQQRLHEETQENLKAAAAEEAAKRKAEADQKAADLRERELQRIADAEQKAADQAARIQEQNERQLNQQLGQYSRIYDERLKLDGKLEELENLQYQRQVAQLQADYDALLNQNVVSIEAFAKHKEALENAEFIHQQRLETIRAEAKEKELADAAERNQVLVEGYDSLRSGISQYFDDIGAKESQYANLALGLGSVLLDTKKRESISKITASTQTAAMGAYEALAPIPVVGPVLGAAAAAGIYVAGAASAARVAGIAHAGMNSIPREGTYLLDGGERIVAPEQNRDLTNFLQGGGSGQQIIINNNAPDTRVTAGYDENNQTIIMVEQVKQSLTNEINSGNGSFSRSLEQRYGLTRSNPF
ncbi:hypothetical protein MAH1_33880 [Sessilibacter sp. MAH1]